MAAHHRMFDKDPYFYEDVVRVPFIWRWPGHVPAQDGPTSQLVSHVDVVPTLLELAGATPAPDAPPLQGQSLVPALREGAAARAAVFCETTIGDLPNPQINARMILRGDWKYVYRLDDTDELYDLCRDSDEMANLASSPEHEPIRRDLAEALAAWMRVTADPLPPPSPIRQTPGA
jgi:choline-sulfatase